MTAVSPEAERAIVEAAAHPQPPAAHIDADRRHDDEVEPSRTQSPAVRDAVRNGNTEGRATRPAFEGVEAQAAMSEIDHHGNVEPDAATPCGGDERARVGLAVERKINGHPGAALERGQMGDEGRGDTGAPGVVRGAQRAPATAKLLAQIVFHSGLSYDGDGATRLCRFGPLLPT